jgi:hypothetical protein
MLVIRAAAKTKQIESIGGYDFRDAPQGAMRFGGGLFFGGSMPKNSPAMF